MPRTLTASDRSTLIKLASTMPKGSPERKAILAGLEKASRSRLLQKVRGMTNDERERLSFKDMAALDQEQYKPAVDAIVRKVTSDIAKDINSAARKLDILYIDTLSGELRESPYKAQGLLEQVIPELTRALEGMV